MNQEKSGRIEESTKDLKKLSESLRAEITQEIDNLQRSLDVDRGNMTSEDIEGFEAKIELLKEAEEETSGLFTKLDRIWIDKNKEVFLSKHFSFLTGLILLTFFLDANGILSKEIANLISPLLSNPANPIILLVTFFTSIFVSPYAVRLLQKNTWGKKNVLKEEANNLQAALDNTGDYEKEKNSATKLPPLENLMEQHWSVDNTKPLDDTVSQSAETRLSMGESDKAAAATEEELIQDNNLTKDQEGQDA